MLQLSTERAIDDAWFNRLGDRTQMTGEGLAYCATCPVPEIRPDFFPRWRIVC